MENDEIEIDLVEYSERFFSTLKKMFKMVFILTLTGFIFFEIKTFLTFHETYSSKAVYIPSKNESTAMFKVEDDHDALIATFNSLLTSDLMKEVICEKLEIDNFSGKIETKRIADTNLVEIITTSDNPQKAYDLLSCILDNYSIVTNSVMSDVKMYLFDTPQIASVPDSSPDYVQNGLKGGYLDLDWVFYLF